jgi:hypothetical protein
MIQENAQPAAPVQHFVHTPGPWEVKGPTIRANADLIALAPEMWQAIQGALRIADLWRPSELCALAVRSRPQQANINITATSQIART